MIFIILILNQIKENEKQMQVYFILKSYKSKTKNSNQNNVEEQREAVVNTFNTINGTTLRTEKAVFLNFVDFVKLITAKF